MAYMGIKRSSLGGMNCNPLLSTRVRNLASHSRIPWSSREAKPMCSVDIEYCHLLSWLAQHLRITPNAQCLAPSTQPPAALNNKYRTISHPSWHVSLPGTPYSTHKRHSKRYSSIQCSDNRLSPFDFPHVWNFPLIQPLSINLDTVPWFLDGGYIVPTAPGYGRIS